MTRARLLSEGAPRRIAWLAVFAVAMGTLEAAVVVYLRELYYPNGFRFPLVRIPERVAIIEIAREATTLMMILAVAALAGVSRLHRFFVFGFLFGVWDLTYYAGLYVFIGWPESLGTWDVLFLIPVPWVGPVLYPMIVSSVLLLGFATCEALLATGREIRPTRAEWAVAVLGAVLIVAAFCREYRVAVEATEPLRFPTGLFVAGLAAGTAPLVRAALRSLPSASRDASSR